MSVSLDLPRKPDDVIRRDAELRARADDAAQLFLHFRELPVAQAVALDRDDKRTQPRAREDVAVRLQVRVGALDGDGADVEGFRQFADGGQAVVRLRSPDAMASLIWSVTCLYIGSG